MRRLRIATILLWFGSMFALAAASDAPLTLAQYLGALEQLRQSVTSAPDSAATSAIAQNLPPEWRVQADGRVFTIAADSLRQALNEYAEKRTPANLAAITSQLDLLVQDARALQGAKIAATPERDKLAEILARREFHNVTGENWYDRWKRAAQRWLAQLLGRILLSSAFPVVSRIVIWGLLALAVAVAAFWVVRNYRQSNIYTKFSGSPDAVSAKPWRDWQAEAQLAAQEGRWRDAVHLSYWAGISFLEGRGLWRPDRARTPREYLRLLPTGDAHRDPLQKLTRSFEQVWYGSDLATAETFAGASALLEQMGCR